MCIRDSYSVLRRSRQHSEPGGHLAVGIGELDRDLAHTETGLSLIHISSDGWGIPELHFLGSWLWRRAMSSALASHVQNGEWSIGQALKVATMIGAGNAERLYGAG